MSTERLGGRFSRIVRSRLCDAGIEACTDYVHDFLRASPDGKVRKLLSPWLPLQGSGTVPHISASQPHRERKNQVIVDLSESSQFILLSRWQDNQKSEFGIPIYAPACGQKGAFNA
jgi:hypothetical protein